MLDNLWQIPVQIDKIGFWSTHVQLMEQLHFVNQWYDSTHLGTA